MAGYLFQGKLDNTVHDISYEQIRQLYRDNQRETRENERITAAAYRGESALRDGPFSFFKVQEEALHLDPKTSGIRIYYPHGIVLQQAMRRNYYRGENRLYGNAVSKLSRIITQKGGLTEEEQELYRMVADMRIAEFSFFLRQFDHVKDWCCSDVQYEALAQHYGLETNWLDITSDFTVALFFATCGWDADSKAWQPLSKEHIAKHPYGMIYHMPSFQEANSWSMELNKFVPEVTEQGQLRQYPSYQGPLRNLVYPLGFQPFMRCHMQSGYGIYMRTPQPLEEDYRFEKLRFRHHEKLSRDVFEMMEGGARIYPHEGLRQADFIIEEIAHATVFSEAAFQYALYRNQYFAVAEEAQCRQKLSQFLVEGKRIEITSRHPWSISTGRKRRIDARYRSFSLEDWYGIRILDKKRIPMPGKLYEPWMFPEHEAKKGIQDFVLRDAPDCGTSIVDRDMIHLLSTMMMARLPDF